MASSAKAAYGGIIVRILDLLSVSPMTLAELCEELGGYSRTSMAKLLWNLSRESKRKPKRIHVSGWVTDHPGQRAYPRAVYSLGDKKDKIKPYRSRETQKQEAKLRYNSKARSLKATNSVFNLALLQKASERNSHGTLAH